MNDETLLNYAKTLHYAEWHIAFELAKRASSERAKIELDNIGKRLYHLEEYYAGLL